MRIKRIAIASGLAVIVVTLGLTSLHLAVAQEAEKPAKEEPRGDAYPLKECPVSGKTFSGKPGAVELYEGRELGFCCPGCPDALKREPERYLPPIDKKIVKQQKPHYPLKTCLISGKEIADDGSGDIIYKNRLVRFCCPGCPKAFLKDPKANLEKLDKAVVEKQKKDYPFTTCLVSGEELGSMGDPIDYVHGNRLVRFCCKGCVKAFRKEPATFMAKLDAANKG
jgi:YHS domain-containing protein